MPKKRLTITLNPEVLKKVDNHIDDKYIMNRSHAIESILMSYFGKDIDTAIILAGGKRIKKTPTFKLGDIDLLGYQTSQLIDSGIKNIIFNTNDDPLLFEDFSKSLAYKKVNLIVEEEFKPLGTAGALLNLRKYTGDKPFLVIHGDVYCEVDIKDVLDLHIEKGFLGTVVLTPIKDAKKYGMATVRGDEITAFLEKPSKNAGPKLISAGIYVFSPEIFDYIAKNKYQSLEEDVFPVLARERSLASYIYSSIWCDITYSDMYRDAKKHFESDGSKNHRKTR